jgi:hypothetical protein
VSESNLIPRSKVSKVSLSATLPQHRTVSILLGTVALACLQFTFVDVALAADAWMLHNYMGGGRCLDATDNWGKDPVTGQPAPELPNYTPIELFDCHGPDNAMQLWSISEADPGGWREIRNIKSGRCLDARTDGSRLQVANNGSAYLKNNTPVQLWDCHNGPMQKWKFLDQANDRPPGIGAGRIVNFFGWSMS